MAGSYLRKANFKWLILRIATSDPEIWTQTADLEPAGTERVDEPAREAAKPMSEKIIRFIRLCWRRRLMIALIVVPSIAISVVYALMQPKVYTATTTLMPPDSASSYADIINMFAPSSGAASLTSEALGLDTPGELFISILESRNVQDGLVARFDLTRYYHARLPEQARTELAASTSIDEDRKSGVISISVTVPSPPLAQKLADGYVEELNRVVTDSSTSAARRERIFLEERVKDIKQDLDESSLALSQFSTKSKTIDMTTQAASTVTARLRLQTELMDGRSQLAGLRQTYSEDNHLVKAVEARDAELQREIDAMGGTAKPNGSSAATDGSAYPTVAELPALGLTYYDLQRKVRVDEALWEELMKEYEAAKVEEARQIPTVKVLDAAELPLHKSGPSRTKIVLIGTFCSLVLACLLAFLLDYWEQMDPQAEPKKTIMEAAGGFMRRRRAL